MTDSTNATLHRWLKAQLTEILGDVPLVFPTTAADIATNRLFWESWREGLSVNVTLRTALPRLRLLIMDNLVGHKNSAWLGWYFSHGILPIYTPLAGSWLAMAESISALTQAARTGRYVSAHG